MRRSRILGMAIALALCAGLVTAPAATATRAPVAHFVVLGPQHGPLTETEESVRAAGGQILQRWPQIGVLVVTSPSADFAPTVRPLPGVVAAGATRNLAELSGDQRQTAASQFDPPMTPAVGEPLEAEQWNLRQIKADQAHEISGGSPDVLVGVLDTGVDDRHPDLAPNFDAAASVSCSNAGVPDTTPGAWRPDPDASYQHGTHVAGIVAAARNGIGVAGVAPNVRIASVKNIEDGLIFPENAICSYIWAAEHGMSVTNASFFVDPWVRWCGDDPDQAAGAAAVRRAVDYAARADVLNVAGIGNTNWDMSHPVVDTYSPVNGEPVERLTDDSCALLPGELPGVVTVAANGANAEKATYASYGISDTDVTAPGGDQFQIPDTPSGDPAILSTAENGTWTTIGGTSAASPHAAGVAALIRSTHPDWSSRRAAAALLRDADRLPCPPGGVFDPGGTGEFLAYCEGGPSGQGFYGFGLIDALAAVTDGAP